MSRTSGGRASEARRPWRSAERGRGLAGHGTGTRERGSRHDRDRPAGDGAAVHLARTRTAFWWVASSALTGAVLAPLPLVPFLSSVPDLLVAEWYLAAGARFPAARPGT